MDNASPVPIRATVSNLLESTGLEYLDPIEDFQTALLRENSRQREGKPTTPNPLFNGQLGDGHFSPLGCEVWARMVQRPAGPDCSGQQDRAI